MTPGEKAHPCTQRYSDGMQYNFNRLVDGARRMIAAGLERYLSDCERSVLEQVEHGHSKPQRLSMPRSGQPTTKRNDSTASYDGLPSTFEGW